MARTAAALFMVATALIVTSTAPAAWDYAPSIVLAGPAADGVHVTWLPGTTFADSYRIYGADGNALTLLATIEGSAPEEYVATVEAGFATYAVSGVLGGAESRLVYAGHMDDECVEVILEPLTVGVGTECLPRLPAVPRTIISIGGWRE